MIVGIAAITGGARFAVHVTPRASRNEIIGWDDEGALKVRVKAPPVDGEANSQLVAFLSKALGVPKSAVQLARGAGGRHKTIEIVGLSAAELGRRLDDAMG